MFRLQRSRPHSSISGKKIDFKFSNFQALQVPKGWDELFVSLVFAGTGKLIAKSSKALVRNGQCQWTDTLSESVSVPQDDISKEHEDLRFIVATGTSKSGILGEATINITAYMSSSASTSVSLPLKNCTYGTILKVKIRRLIPRANFRNRESKSAITHTEGLTTEYGKIGISSKGSDGTGARKMESSSRNSLSCSTQLEEPHDREPSFSTSVTSQSCNAQRGSIGVSDFSPRKKSNDVSTIIEKQDSKELQSDFVGNPSKLSCDSKITGPDNDDSLNICKEHAHSPPSNAMPPLRYDGSFKNLQEAAETVAEVQANVPGVGHKNGDLANIHKDLSPACADPDDLKKEVEVEQLKFLLEESMVKQRATNNKNLQGERMDYIHKELEKEIKFQQESNANLTQLLKKSQESNVELVSVLQELEETTKKQKIEVENMSAVQQKFTEMEILMQENLEENRLLELQLQELQESEKKLQLKVQFLEKALGDKIHEIENWRSLNKQSQTDLEEQSEHKFSHKQGKAGSPEANVPNSHEDQYSEETVSIAGSNMELIREMEALKEKMAELERDCNELTDENLELLIKLKESKNNYQNKGLSCDVSPNGLPFESLFNSDSVTGKVKSQLYDMEDRSSKNVHVRNHLAAAETSTIITEVCAQLQMAFSQVNKPRYNASFCLNNDTGYDDCNCIYLESADAVDHKVLAGSISKYLVELNKLLEARNTNYENVLKCGEAQIREKDHKIAELQIELENYMELEQRLQDEQSRLMETQKECQHLKIKNLEKKATAESLMKECSFLQELSDDLRKQKLELHEHCMDLEIELEESHKNLTNYSKRVEQLEEKLSSVPEEFASKEKSLNSEKEALVLANKEYKEQLIHKESLFNDMCMEKTTEVEKLQREVVELTGQISAVRDEREGIASEAQHELNSLREEKFRLESDLQEVQVKLELTENKLYEIQQNSEPEVEHLTNELAASKKHLETIITEHEKVLKLLEDYKSDEQKLKSYLDILERNLTGSEDERQKLLEENAIMKVQLQKSAELQDEVLVLQSKLSSANLEKEKLEESMHSLSGYCDELKAEKSALIEKINGLQKALSDLEICKKSRVALEEKLLHRERDLVAKEALCAENAELKIEISQIKRANRQFQQMLERAEEEKGECSKKVEVLTEELKLMKEENLGQSETSNKSNLSVAKFGNRVTAKHEDIKFPKNHMLKSCNQHQEAKMKPSVNIARAPKIPKDQQNAKERQHLGEDQNDYYNHDEVPPASQVELLSRIRFLENKLAEALEANNTNKLQFNRLVSKGGSDHLDAPRKPTVRGEVVTKEKYERTKSSLEVELRDIRERYLHMSLKYAEVESHREELMMKLRGAKTVKRWFS